MAAPATLELVDAAELADVYCTADTVLGETVSPASADFVKRYTASAAGFRPDSFGAAYYDGSASSWPTALRKVGPDADRLRGAFRRHQGLQGHGPHLQHRGRHAEHGAHYVWSQNLTEVMRASREIRAGVVWVNTPLTRELRSHFGGVKDSGFGGDGAIASPEFFTQAKSTIVPLGPVAMARLGAGA